jgi:trk system potassium uptake protein
MLTGTTMVIGGGRIGTALARQLLATGHEVIVLERDGASVAQLVALDPDVPVVQADGVDPAALEAAGIRRASVVAAVTGDDATNLVVAALARLEFAVPHTIARIVDPAHAWLFHPSTGVDTAVDQAALLTRAILDRAELGNDADG